MSGVPHLERTASDFIQVRAALVRRLGGANEAIVWTRIDYRCGAGSHTAHEADGYRWWAATYDTLSDETGLSPRQVRGAIEALSAGGFLARQKHFLGGSYDHTWSYSPVIADVPELSDRRDVEVRSDVPEMSDLSSFKTLKTSRRKASTPIPDEWAPTDSHREFARERRIDIDSEALRFHNHAESVDRRLSNWDAGFRNWLLKATPGTAKVELREFGTGRRKSPDDWMNRSPEVERQVPA